MRVLNHGRVRFRVCVSDETTRQEKEFPLGVVCPPPHPQPFFCLLSKGNALGGVGIVHGWETQAAGHFLSSCPLPWPHTACTYCT